MTATLPAIPDGSALLDDAEGWSVERLRAHQLAWLQESVRAAHEHVPH